MSLSKENKYPEIRFKGFTEAWEQRKLSDIVERVVRKNKNLESKLPLTISAQDGLIDQNIFFNKQVASKDVSGYYLLYNGEFAYNKSYSNGYPFGAVKRLDKYEKGVLSTLYIAFCPTNVNTDFLVAYYDSSYWQKEVAKNAAEGARNHGLLNISPTDFFQTEIFIPINNQEQKQIGKFFKRLDDTIALHQCKLDRLENLKKAYLQVLLPNIEENTPEMRFTNFNESWEQRKLEDISTYIRGSFPQPYTNPKFYDEKDGKPFVQVADIGFDLKLNADTKAHISKLAEPKSRFVKAGKVIVALQGSIEKSIGRTAITQYDAYFDRTILIFEDYKIPVDKQYFAQVIKALFEREKERAWGATISTITKKHLNNFIIGVPSIEEQKQIGMFFKQLDNNIALHQEKLDKLFILKKAYLKMMFI